MFPEETYRVIVEVVEVQGLVWPAPSSGVKPKLPNPFVEVFVGNESQWTSTRETTSTCTFNRLFLFSNVPADESIEVRVNHKMLLGQELIGIYSTSIAAVRDTPDHHVVQTLCPLIIRERPSEPRGFVRLSIHVLRAGEVIKTDGAGGTGAAQRPRILYTPELDFESYYLTFNVYFGQDILKNVDPPNVFPPSPRIQIEFMNSILTTQTCQTTREPTWCEALRFPATVPCSADKIVAELWVDAVSDHRISYTTLSFDTILKKPRPATWMNFYTDVSPVAKRQGKREAQGAFAAFAALFELEEEEEAPALTGFHYYGRILVSAVCVKHKSPGPPQAFTCRPIEPPRDQELILWADLFELSGLGNQTDILIQVALGDWVVSLEPTTQLMDTVGFTGDAGRIAEEKFFLPTDLESSYDLIIRVYGKPRSIQGSRGGTELRRFIAYARLPPSALLRNAETTKWIDLTPADKTTDMIETRTSHGARASSSRTVSLLASIVLRRPESIQGKTRAPKSTFSVTRYVCNLCCYQAIYLPVLRSCLPSPHVVISLGGGSATTQTLFHTIHPDWHEILSFNCSLPEDLTLARDLVVQVYSRESMIGEVKIPARYLMSEDGRHPQWYPLTSRRYPKSQARILCAFHLAPLDRAQIPTAVVQELPSFTVEYEPFDLRLLILGCRLFSSVCGGMGDLTTSPEIQVEFGRQPHDLNSRLWYGTCDRVVRGQDGNFDYFCPLEVKCFLPRSEMFQTFIELRVFQPHKEGSRELGTSYLYLTPLIPRFSARMKQMLQVEFGYVPPALSELTPPPLALGGPRRRFLAPIVNVSQRDRLFRCAQHDKDLEILQIAMMDDEEPLPASEGRITVENGVDVGAQQDDGVIEESLSHPLTSGSLNAYTSEVDVFFAREASQFRKKLKQSKYTQMLSNFISTNAAPQDEDQTVDELNRPLESELRMEELPYLVLPIIGPGRNGTVSGEPDIVGVLKVRCKVFSAGQDKTQESETVDQLHLKFLNAPRMKARVHVFSASGLLPSLISGQSGQVETSEWYLTLRNAGSQIGAGATGVHDIKDTKFTGKGFAPDFYRSFELDVQFPENALLTLGVASTGSLWTSSYFVGRTVIDLENRWFHPGFLALTGESTPTLIETRTLRNVANEEPTGNIRMWLQLLTEDEAAKRPLVPVSMVAPEMVQVRVVIWQVKGVPVQEYGSVSLYVVGLMSGTTSGTIVTQETDTHWNSTDGRGVFNWRFIFDVMVPSEASQLRLQVWGRNLLATHESIAETVIDLSSDLLKCKSLKEVITLDRAWVKLYHPANPAQLMGYLDTEIMLTPEQYAIDNPVGLGRDKINRDPFLPEVTENRNYIATSALGQTVFGASDKVLYGAKICSWLITLFIIITLYTVFSKIFLS